MPAMPARLRPLGRVATIVVVAAVVLSATSCTPKPSLAQLEGLQLT